MKYYLIIGYQLLEKHLEYPTIKIKINGHMVDEFSCDNEQSTTIAMRECVTVVHHGPFYNKTYETHETLHFRSPKKFKVIEVDLKDAPDEGELTLDVGKNNSNHNNGFMNKRSMVVINPVYLIRKDILDNESVLHNIIKRFRKAKFERMDVKKWNSKVRPTWPGFSTYTKEKGADFLWSPKGGNFRIDFKIIKKHKTHMLVTGNSITKGFFHTDGFFHAWHNYQFKRYFETKLVIEKNIDSGIDIAWTPVSTMEVVPSEKLKKINNSNED